MKERRRYWDYYLAIEDDLIRLSRYIDFVKGNMCCFSIELARLLLVAGAELDDKFRELCNIIDSSKKACNFEDYYRIVTKQFSNFRDVERYVKRSNRIVLTPFKEWTRKNPPDWWDKGYNGVKHGRRDHFSQANLWNVLNATAALQIVLFHLYSLQEDRMFGYFAPADLPRLIVRWDPEEPEHERTTYSLQYRVVEKRA